MGGAAGDAAPETAGVVVMGADLGRLPYAIAPGRKTRRVIRRNKAFLLLAIVALVVLNGLRLPRSLDRG